MSQKLKHLFLLKYLIVLILTFYSLNRILTSSSWLFRKKTQSLLVSKKYSVIDVFLLYRTVTLQSHYYVLQQNKMVQDNYPIIMSHISPINTIFLCWWFFQPHNRLFYMLCKAIKSQKTISLKLQWNRKNFRGEGRGMRNYICQIWNTQQIYIKFNVENVCCYCLYVII